MSDIHGGHRQRMFEKFEKYGFSIFNDHEKLELILFFSVPRRDTNELAHKLLNRFHSIAGVMDASPQELKEFPFITDRTIQLFRMIKETSALYSIEKVKKKTYLCTTDEIATYFQMFFVNAKDERLAILSLNHKCGFLGCEFIAEGDISSVGVSTRKVIETVLKTRANEVVLCHNHPGGIALPSSADIFITKEIKTALESVNVCLKDHIILSIDDYVSMAESKEYSYIFEK